VDRIVQIFGKDSTYVEMQNAHLTPNEDIAYAFPDADAVPVTPHWGPNMTAEPRAARMPPNSPFRHPSPRNVKP
jgi:hypothetical protein